MLEPFLVGGGLPADGAHQVGAVVDELIGRRRTTYAHDRRLIGDFQVEPGVPGEMRVSVACGAKPVPVL